MINNKFIHLNIHSEYSIVDGFIKIDNLINLAYEYNYSSVCLTDLNNLFGLINFYELSCKKGIKPIIGADFYINLESNIDNLGKITILSLTNLGYKNLINLISDSYKSSFKLKFPIISKSLLLKYNKDLLIISGGLNGYIYKYLIKNDFYKIEKIINLFNKYFKDRYYLKITRLGINNEEEYISNIIKISKYYKLPIVATNEVRFLKKNDFYYHEIKVAIYNKAILNNNKYIYSENQYFKNENEMCLMFNDIPEALINTVEIAKRCNVYLKSNKYYLPNFNKNNTEDNIYLSKLSNLKLRYKLKEKFKNKNDLISNYNIYKERLNNELKTIKDMNFSGYFLIVTEFVQWAKNNNIYVGPGRGSGASSLVAYVLNITNIDPVQFDLIFERFLNIQRISLPDLDIDFCMKKRDLVINHVKNKYGSDYVSQIITFGTLTAKSVIKDVGRVLGYTYSFTNKISSLVSSLFGINLEKALKTNSVLNNLYCTNKEVEKIINISKKLENYIKNVGTHSGGLIISPYKISNIIPLYYDKIGEKLTQFNKNDIEKIGLIKFDFLGLKTLTIINSTIESVNKKLSDKDKINILNINLNDKKSFEILNSCNTIGIFQLESKGIKELIKKIKPNKFEDIINLIALFRPGPLKSGMVDNFINRKNGKEKIYFPNKNCNIPILKDILISTYGVIIYQEQIMKIAQVFSDYTLSESDILRHAISKKNIEEMNCQKKKFIEGALKKGINTKLSEKIFHIIEKFAGYGFNKAHSTSYALISYQTLWLKSNFTSDFFSSMMNYHINDSEKIDNIINECKIMKINFLPININKSLYNFYVDKDNNIIYGLGCIKGIVENSIKEIVIERKKNGYFKNLLDLCLRIPKNKLSKKSIELLIENGALDIFKETRYQMMKNLIKYIKISIQYNLVKTNKQIDIFGLKSLIKS